MSSGRLLRLSGAALLVGGLLNILTTVISTFLFTGPAPTSTVWTSVQLLVFIGSLLALIGLPGVYLVQARQTGWLGLIGFILSFLAGIILGAGGEIVSGFVLPWLATNAPKLAAEQGPPALIVVFIVINLGGAVGAVLLGLATMRAGVLPRGAGVLLIVGGVVTVITAAPFPVAISTLLSNIGGVIIFLGIAWIGYTLWARKDEAPQQMAVSL